jgi:hypothetical protein
MKNKPDGPIETGSTKSLKLEEILEMYVKENFGASRKDNICVTCGSDKVKLEDFRDSLSRKEWKISRMCQKCQDSVFGVD